MKVFVAGGTGVLGSRAVARLVAAGHDVTALSRSDDKAALLRRTGAVPVAVDLFDPAALRREVAGHDVVCNLATKIPPFTRAAVAGAWAENARIRTEASRNLVDAALAAGASRYVQESIAFMYRDGGDDWIDEDAVVEPPPIGRSAVEAERQAERFTTAGGTGVVLRFGQFYAAESVHSLAMARMLRLRMAGLPGPPDAFGVSVAADDAAAGVVAALGAPAGAWNVADDDPLTRRTFNAAFAEALGVKPPIVSGTAMLRLNANARLYLRSQRVSNRRFKEATGWTPAYPDAAVGLRAMAAEMRRAAR